MKIGDCMKTNKITVIISTYNTEKYIEKCLDSLLNQNYKNLEILVFDDGSEDNTINIVKEYTKRDDRLQLFCGKHQGLSHSRNLGLEKATGDYLSFIDSDDFIPDNFYSELIGVLDKEKADIAICDMNIVYEEPGIGNVVSPGSLLPINAINVINTGLSASACNKLFKRELFQYQFSEGKVNEDLAVIIPTLLRASKLAYTNETYYNYVQRKNSIQNSKFQEKKFDIFYGVALTLDRIKDHPDYHKLKDIIVYNQLITLLLYVIPKEKSVFYRRKILKKYSRLVHSYDILKNEPYQQFLNTLNFKNKMYYKLLVWLTVKHCYCLTNLLINSYDCYKKISAKNVIPVGLTMEHLIDAAKNQQKMKESKVSITVVVPNYNYEKFLYERVYSILYQKVKIEKLILLDDCSKDNSRQIIDQLVSTLSPYISIEKIYNEINSGSPFKQWEKGFQLAQSDYVWIAEADDYSDCNFLKEVVKPILKDRNIVISYSDTAFIDGVGNQFLRSIRSEIDIQKTGHWNRSYVISGKEEFNHYTYLNCTIANVSSALIKRGSYSGYFALAGKYRQAGDWIFYANVMQEGKVAYFNKALNYYRVHGNNVSSVTKKEAHMKEMKEIHQYYRDQFKLSEEQEKEIKKRYSFLKEVWNLNDEKTR